MTTANYSPAAAFAAFGEQSDRLDALPKVFHMPGGRLYGNYVMFTTLRPLRALVALTRKQLESVEYEALSMKDRREFADKLLDQSDALRKHLDLIKSFHIPGIIHRVTLNRVENVLFEFSDLAGNAALGADAEISALSKELSDVL